jgi:hypothetical protein
MKLRKDTTDVRKAFASAAARIRLEGKPGVKPEQKPAGSSSGPSSSAQRANKQAADLRRESRELATTLEELKAQNLQLQQENSALKTQLAELEPNAKRWQSTAHRKKEELILKLPKELQARARKMDVDDVELLVSVRGENGSGTNGAAGSGAGPTTGPKSLEEAHKLGPDIAAKFEADVRAGTVKIDDKTGIVVTA